MKRIYELIVLAIAVLTFSGASANAQTVAPQPGDPCSEVGMIYGNIGTGAGSGGNMMACNGTTWVSFISCGADSTAKNPGEVKLGTSEGLVCSTENTGILRYNAAAKCAEFCNGTVWACLAVPDP